MPLDTVTSDRSSEPPISSSSLTLSEAAQAYWKTVEGMKKSFFEVFHTAADWITTCRPIESLSRLSAHVKQLKNFSSLAKIPEAITETAEQAGSACKEKTNSSYSKLINKICCLILPTTDVLETLQQRLFPLATRIGAAVGAAGFGALIYVGAFEFNKNMQRSDAAGATSPLSSREITIKTHQASLNSLGAVSDVAIGVLGLAGAVTSFATAPWIMLALSTNSLVCSLGSHFLPQLYPTTSLTTKAAVALT